MNNLDLDQDRMADYLRLQNLKGLTKRLRGRADQEISELQNPDLGGTANEMPLPPEIPVELGNFDVRANQKIENFGDNTPASQDQSFMSKIYSGLQHIGKGRIPEQEDESFVDQMARQEEAPRGEGVPLAGPGAVQAMLNPQKWGDLLTGNRTGLQGEPLQAGFNPMPAIASIYNSVNGQPAQQQEALAIPQTKSGQMQDPLEAIRTAVQNDPSLLAELPEETRRMLGETQANPEKPFAPQAPEPQTTIAAEVEPGNVQVGSISTINGTPTLKEKIDQYLGPVPQEMMSAAESYEKAMDAYSKGLDDVTARLNDQEKGIRERIESRNLTTTDKILMAIALVAPLVVSGFLGGKEAVVGALAGSADAFAKGLANREKESKEDEEALTELALAKSNVGKEKAGIAPLTAGFRSKIAESIPNKELREIFTRDGELIGDRLVINSGNPNLPIKADAIRDETDYKRLKAEAPKLAKGVATLDKAESLIDNMHKLADMSLLVRDQKNLLQKGLQFATPLNLYDSATGALKAFIPWTRDTVRDENGNEVKIAELMGTYRAQLADAWRDAHGNNSNAFKATEAHFDKQLPDPTTWKSFLQGQSDIKQFKKQLDLVKENFEEAINYIDSQGFDVSRLKERFGATGRNQELKKGQSDRARAEAAAQDAINKSKGR